MHEGHHGGRPRCTAHGPVAAEELTNKMSGVTRRPNTKFANDATSCCDRTLTSLALIVSRKFGAPKNACVAMARNLEEAKCKLKKQLGASEEQHQHNESFLICRSGQGSSDSPMMRLFASSVLFQVHEEKHMEPISHCLI